MKLKNVKITKAENYSGNEVSCFLKDMPYKDKCRLISKIIRLKYNPSKIKIEYKDKKDAYYNETITHKQLEQYEDFDLFKFKGYCNDDRLSITCDFVDNIITFKSDYSGIINNTYIKDKLNELLN